ncbi:MAG: hypothetical protein H0V01_04160 [Bacteroidetes bacterium]|nr:hypothetical protein [Bacteroidota bacterium]HET6245708.1 hypothetical protein [Bacteroidia bacterium]
METALFLSYTGFNQSLVILIKSEKNSFYLGPKISLSNYYMPLSSIWGINMGIRHDFAQAGTLKAFFNIDYQNSLFRPNGFSEKIKYNIIHEFNASYGLHYNLFKGLSIGNSIGFGRYLEFYHDIIENRKNIYQGYSGLLKIHMNYDF